MGAKTLKGSGTSDFKGENPFEGVKQTLLIFKYFNLSSSGCKHAMKQMKIPRAGGNSFIDKVLLY